MINLGDCESGLLVFEVKSEGRANRGIERQLLEPQIGVHDHNHEAKLGLERCENIVECLAWAEGGGVEFAIVVHRVDFSNDCLGSEPG